jgi:hypothetical protein
MYIKAKDENEKLSKIRQRQKEILFRKRDIE